ncbi:MAG TPA: hypothetical protein VKV06_17295, partial [Acidimicrobiales bacterium]|nr:hypothetical protein [Acidimicrobiales bacterium]
GTWRAEEADDERRRSLPDPSLDDGGWAEVPVPGQWRLTPRFAASEGPLLYRRRWAGQRPEEGQRAWLTFEGMFYQADVWLDGSYVGDTEGYFAPSTFEVTGHLAARDEHLLAVELACPPEADPRRRHNLTGVFQGGDAIDPAWNPGGIWAPVHVDLTGPVRIAALRVICREATAERAALEIDARLDAAEAGQAELSTTFSREGAGAGSPDAVVSSVRTLAQGDNRVRWRVTLERPALWWPRALGAQPLYDVAVTVGVDGRTSDRREVTTGLRRVRMQRWITTVNGERIFLKGANLGPTRRALAEVADADVAADLALAADAGLDLLRVRGHVTVPALYEQADRAGMLLWQDLPVPPGYESGRQAAHQARQAVDLLGHHPSIVLWCGRNEPPETTPTEPAAPAASITRRAIHQAVPDVGEALLDRHVRRAIERADGSRPVVARSGLLPHPVGGTDSHLYPGWYDGDIDLAVLLARWPAVGRFVGEFGAQAVPATASFLQSNRWPHLDWQQLEQTYGLRRQLLERWSPVADHATFDSWRDATQQHQAEVIRRSVETLRRLKYRPTGGFCLSLLADAQPAVSSSVLDDERKPKAGFAALRAACAPVIVVADPLAEQYRPGGAVRTDIHVVSDRRTPLDAVEATAVLSWPGGSRTWRYRGSVGADSCVRVGRARLTLPADTPDGELRLDLRLAFPEAPSGPCPGAVTNEYRSVVRRVFA